MQGPLGSILLEIWKHGKYQYETIRVKQKAGHECRQWPCVVWSCICQSVDKPGVFWSQIIWVAFHSNSLKCKHYHSNSNDSQCQDNWTSCHQHQEKQPTTNKETEKRKNSSFMEYYRVVCVRGKEHLTGVWNYSGCSPCSYQHSEYPNSLNAFHHGSLGLLQALKLRASTPSPTNLIILRRKYIPDHDQELAMIYF